MTVNQSASFQTEIHDSQDNLCKFNLKAQIKNTYLYKTISNKYLNKKIN